MSETVYECDSCPDRGTPDCPLTPMIEQDRAVRKQQRHSMMHGIFRACMRGLASAGGHYVPLLDNTLTAPEVEPVEVEIDTWEVTLCRRAHAQVDEVEFRLVQMLKEQTGEA